jgi:hypothetical protein
VREVVFGTGIILVSAFGIYSLVGILLLTWVPARKEYDELRGKV